MGKPKTKYWGQFWGAGQDDDDDWEIGGKDFGSTDPERNKGKVGFMPASWSEEQRKTVDHVICPDCSATVYASGYMERDKCDVCWTMFPDKSWNLPASEAAAKANKSVQGSHSKYGGSYSQSLKSFAKQTRSSVEVADSESQHLLSRIHMATMINEGWISAAENNSPTNDKQEGIRNQTKHVTKQHSAVTTDADEYLSSTSEAYAHVVAQDMELFARVLQAELRTPKPDMKGENNTPLTEEERLDRATKNEDKQADLRRMIEIMMGEFGAAVGHKIGDDWFLRDTTEEAAAIQKRAGLFAQPMYGAALYGDEGTDEANDIRWSGMSMNTSENSTPESESNRRKIAAKIRQGIKKADVAEALNDIASEVAEAKSSDRVSVMEEKLLPVISKILEEEGSEELDKPKVQKRLKDALDGTAKPKRTTSATTSDEQYENKMAQYIDGLGDEIAKERELLAKRKGREDKWSPTAKNIANAYGHDPEGSGYSVFDSQDPLKELSSVDPKEVPLSFKAQQMLEAIENERRVTWAESGDTTDRLVELNFGNLKVFRQEDTFSPQLLLAVDSSGSTGCICNAGKDGYQDVGSLMWEVAATISSAASEANTKQYAYHSTGSGFLTTIEVPTGKRPVCNSEIGGRADFYSRNAKIVPEHGGGTPELAMLHYINDKAQSSGDLSSTTVILIVDGQPDDRVACKAMSEQLVAAGVQFGIVLCGGGFYKYDEDYYSSAISVSVNSKEDIDKAIPKLMSLIQERGLA
jgi:hypothetical protein